MAIEIKTDLSNVQKMYETIFLTVPTLEEAAYQELTKKVVALIEGAGGEIINLEHWGQRRLEYEMEGHTMAYYTLVEYNSPPDFITRLEREFRYSERILRFLTVKIEKHHAAFNKKRREQGLGIKGTNS